MIMIPNWIRIYFLIELFVWKCERRPKLGFGYWMRLCKRFIIKSSINGNGYLLQKSTFADTMSRTNFVEMQSRTTCLLFLEKFNAMFSLEMLPSRRAESFLNNPSTLIKLSQKSWWQPVIWSVAIKHPIQCALVVLTFTKKNLRAVYKSPHHKKLSSAPRY